VYWAFSVINFHREIEQPEFVTIYIKSWSWVSYQDSAAWNLQMFPSFSIKLWQIEGVQHMQVFQVFNLHLTHLNCKHVLLPWQLMSNKVWNHQNKTWKWKKCPAWLVCYEAIYYTAFFYHYFTIYMGKDFLVRKHHGLCENSILVSKKRWVIGFMHRLLYSWCCTAFIMHAWRVSFK
jgi:hypothetical protein